MKSNTIGIVASRGRFQTASRALRGLALSVLALPCLLSAQTTLQHRYSFVSDASDSVGGSAWNGTVVSPNGGTAANINNGLTLAGGASPGFSGYVTLPGGILNDTTNVTVEFWATQSAANGWAEVWSFNSGTPSYWAFISDGENNNNNLEQALRLNNNETDSQAGGGMPGSETHYTVTFNASTLVDTIWQGQSVIASATAPNSSYTPGAQNFSGTLIGQDPWPDPQWAGTLYEFRIYNGVLTPNQIAIDDLAGSTNVVSNFTPVSATLSTSSTNLVLTGIAQGISDATFTTTTGSVTVNATGLATNWVSSNPSVIQVNSSGVVSAVAFGQATISATVNGVTATSPTIFVTAPQTLLHRYSFASDASDSVGGAQWDGTLVAANGGTNATISNGLVLPGGGGGGYSGYLSLPKGILTNTTSVTVETWVTQNTANQWATIWDFANNGSQNFEMCPFPQRGILNLDVAVTPNGGEVDTITGSLFPSGTEVYTAFTFNAGTLTGSIYTNGVLGGVASYPNTTYVPGSIGAANGTSENWLGNDTYNDQQFQGTVYEFRIWNGAVTPLYMNVASAAGPSVVVTNITPTQLTVTVPNSSMIGSQTQQATATGNFIQASGVNVTGGATNWVSSNPNVLTVNQSGLITAVSGGTAKVSATAGGVTATSSTITVATTPPQITQYPTNLTLVVGNTANFSVAGIGGLLHYQWSFDSTAIAGATNSTLTLADIQLSQAGTYSVLVSNSAGSSNVTAVLTVDQAILEHRYSFVSDASDSVGGPAWNGTIIAPNGGTNATISNGLFLPGGGGPGFSGYVKLPPGILTNTTSLTVECWVTQNNGNQWAQIFNFGSSQSANMGLIPLPNRDNGNLELGITPNGGELDTIAPIHFPTNSEVYGAFVFNTPALTGSLYGNGSLLATRSFPNNTYIPASIGGSSGTANDVFGQDPFPDPQFQGTIYEFRIWNGAVTPLYLEISQIAGPSVVVTNFTPTSIDVSVTNDTMIQGQSQFATAIGNFVNASGISITSMVTNWSSSNPSVLTVSSNGLVTAVGTGSATISATFNGTTGISATISVPSSPPIITQEPAASDTFLQGATLTASVSNIGTTPFVYRWYFNSGTTPIYTSSSPTLTIPNVQPGNAGTYSVVISNVAGTVTSSSLSVSVMTPTPYEQAVQEYGPVAYWPMQETSGTTAYDVIGGDNGVYTNFPTVQFSSSTVGQPGPSQSFFGGSSSSVLFENAIADIPVGQLNITNAITVTAWIQQLVAEQFASIIGHGDDSWRITITENGAAGDGIAGGNDGLTGSDANAPTTLNTGDGNWHMVAYTYSGNPSQPNNGVLYVDGVPVGTNSVTAPPTGDNLDVWIGGSPDYSTNRIVAYAYIAHAAVFNQAFTAAQMNGLFNGTYVAPPPPQQAFTFDGAPVISGTSLKFSLTSAASGTVYLLSSTNLLTPISQWTPVWTNVLSGAGTITTNLSGAVHSGYKQQFYMLSTTNK